MITDFLNTATSKEDLAIALKVLREFKSHENMHEWLAIPMDAWAKLEQLEEFLKHLVEGTPLAEDTLNYMITAQREQTRKFFRGLREDKYVF